MGKLLLWQESIFKSLTCFIEGDFTLSKAKLIVRIGLVERLPIDKVFVTFVQSPCMPADLITCDHLLSSDFRKTPSSSL